MKTQMQHWNESHRKVADANNAFMDMVKCESNPMTNQDLERLIARWPERYSRFAGFVGRLTNGGESEGGEA